MPQWNPRANELFLTAAELQAPAERAAFLDRECAEPALRRQVEALLAAHAQAGSFLDQPAAAPATSEFTPEAPPATQAYAGAQPGVLVGGRYELLERLGEGGMGEVWVAKQSEPVKRRVALKLIKPGMDSRAVLQRFEAERQALALMDHPNIARVLDGGVDGEPGASATGGRPYFVMELVNGLPLSRFCDEAKLTLRQRLELFVPICQAVQHAHHKGIVHRDLKPSNILVTLIDGKPVPKVIDFGVAKATGGKLTDETLSTGFGAVVGTLEYMSPEQAGFSGQDIDTRADIYSLGVILYELLTGLRPIDGKRLRNAALTEMIRIIQEEEPSKPSTRLSTDAALPSLAAMRQTEPKKLMALLRGELDWVVMKCLEKDRGQRYETANGLARDIERYLADEVVEAKPPSAGYRLKKFIRRNKAQAIAASLVAFALLAGVVGTSWGLVEARRQEQLAIAAAAREAERADGERQARLAEEEQRKKAERKEAEANAVINFFEDHVFAAARPKGQVGGLGKDITLAQALVASLSALDDGFKNQPLVEARLRLTLGITFHFLGDGARGVAQEEKARALYLAHLGPQHKETLKSMNNLANTYVDLGRYQDGLKLHEETLAARQRVYPPDDPEILISMQNLAAAYAKVGRLQEALKLDEETLAARQRVLGPEHPDTLTSMSNVASVLERLGRFEEAIRVIREVLAAEKRLNPPDHPDTLGTMTVLSKCLESVGRHEEALQVREETLAGSRRALPPDHPDTIRDMGNLANSYSAVGRKAEALKLCEETLAAMKRTLGPDHPDTLTSMGNLAILLFESGRGEEAVRVIDDCWARANGKTVNPVLLPMILGMRGQHFGRRGDAAASRATAEMWDKLDRLDEDCFCLFFAACCRARAAKFYAKANQPAESAADADRAMDLLRRSVKAGWNDTIALKKQPELSDLRERADFKKLLADLEAAAKPPANPPAKP